MFFTVVETLFVSTLKASHEPLPFRLLIIVKQIPFESYGVKKANIMQMRYNLSWPFLIMWVYQLELIIEGYIYIKDSESVPFKGVRKFD